MQADMKELTLLLLPPRPCWLRIYHTSGTLCLCPVLSCVFTDWSLCVSITSLSLPPLPSSKLMSLLITHNYIIVMARCFSLYIPNLSLKHLLITSPIPCLFRLLWTGARPYALLGTVWVYAQQTLSHWGFPFLKYQVVGDLAIGCQLFWAWLPKCLHLQVTCLDC